MSINSFCYRYYDFGSYKYNFMSLNSFCYHYYDFGTAQSDAHCWCCRDHSGGSKEMRQHYPNIRVYGSSSDHVPDITQ